MRPFETRTYGKWIMAGEHAVLRGSPAMAFPLTNRTLQLQYAPEGSGLTVDFYGAHGEELKLLFYGVIENAMSRLNIKEPLQGHFVITSGLPVGAGLGASAALCGAVARWCEGQQWIASEDVYEFARRLEDLFHGESSGVDLAVSLSGKGIRFVRGGERSPLVVAWWPELYLSYCGSRGITSTAVAKVKSQIEANPEVGAQIDLKMRSAVEKAIPALANPDAKEGFHQLALAINTARECFEAWGLAGGDVAKHMQLLEEEGAGAVKPTGSGGGGYVLSLWDTPVPASLKASLVKIPRP